MTVNIVNNNHTNSINSILAITLKYWA